MEIQEILTLNLESSPSDTRLARKSGLQDKETKEKVESSNSSDMPLSTTIMKAIAESVDIEIPSFHITFLQDDETGDIVIRIIDDNTGDIIRQIPPEELIRLKKTIGNIQGLFLDEKA